MNVRPVAVAVALLLHVAPLVAEAQPSAKVYRIGVISMSSGPNPRLDTFRQGLREMGYQDREDARAHDPTLGARAGGPGD